jgi:hypothetical protein
LAEQFQPAADADPGIANALAAATAASGNRDLRIEQTSMSLVDCG